jgi:hypothetical protein
MKVGHLFRGNLVELHQILGTTTLELRPLFSGFLDIFAYFPRFSLSDKCHQPPLLSIEPSTFEVAVGDCTILTALSSYRTLKSEDIYLIFSGILSCPCPYYFTSFEFTLISITEIYPSSSKLAKVRHWTILSKFLWTVTVGTRILKYPIIFDNIHCPKRSRDQISFWNIWHESEDRFPIRLLAN